MQTLPRLAEVPICSGLPERLLLGTSSWSSKDWLGVFYPEGTRSSDFIAYYSARLPVVEIDASFYAIPARRTVEGWREKTPAGFRFAAKVPQVITHEKLLLGCEAELEAFLETMGLLGDRLGPLLFQFPYFKKSERPDDSDFLRRLGPFLKRLPKSFEFALEVRNKGWVTERLTGMLREAGVALALIDHPWFSRPGALMKQLDAVTAGFCYVRWLGDRYKIEEQTTAWNRTIVDRRRELTEWSEVIRELLSRNVKVYAFANNHYGGFAIETLRLFRECYEQAAAGR